jgi:hypothetical protein
MDALAIVGVVLAVPGVVDVLAHAGKYLWDKAHETGPKSVLDFAESYINRKEARQCLELAEDVYCDTLDQGMKQVLERFVSDLRQGILEIDRNLEDFQTAKKEYKRSSAQDKISKNNSKAGKSLRRVSKVVGVGCRV